jgi:hypothetical protein
MSTLAYLRGNRTWFIPGFVVWGVSSDAELSFVTVTVVEGQQQINYLETSVGGSRQTVSFDSLVDHRGNKLPATINTAKVIPLPKAEGQVFIVGREFSSGFSISRDNSDTSPIATDLVIIEMD